MTEEEIFFRASGLGALMVEGRGKVLTEKQAETLKELQEKPKRTEKQQATLDDLIAKRDAPPELSATAKDFIKKMWLLNEKGFYEELSSKAVQKGLFNEQDGLELVSEVEDNFYIKNSERRYLNNVTGECDINVMINGRRVIKDIKCSWSPKTFMGGDLSTLYEYQGIAYMYLYDADEFHLHYCLTDCPAHLYEAEVWKLKNKFNVIDPDDEDVKPLFDQLHRNLIFSDNPAYTKEERVKTFVIHRDKDKEAALLAKIPPAIAYYKSLTLNIKE